MGFEIDTRDGKLVAYDTDAPNVVYPVTAYDADCNETDDEELAVGGVISFADDNHKIFIVKGYEYLHAFIESIH